MKMIILFSQSFLFFRDGVAATCSFLIFKVDVSCWQIFSYKCLLQKVKTPIVLVCQIYPLIEQLAMDVKGHFI